MEIPELNNVYGLIDCSGRMKEFAATLQRFRDADVWLKVSNFDGTESIRMEISDATFQAYGDHQSEFLFNGAVAGEEEMVCEFTRELHSLLRLAGFNVWFEIYDRNRAPLATFGTYFGTRHE